MGLTALRIEDLPHYNYDDYVQWEGRWEIINGIPYAMTPQPTIEHQEISGRIYRHLGDLLENCKKCKALLPVDWQITEDTVTQPDVLVVCGENIKGKKLLIPPVLVFEVLSPSTSHKDRILKYQLYQSAGVKYYCIVDPETKCAEIFMLKNSEYEKVEDFKEEKITFDFDPCSIAFDFGEIFKE